MQRFWKSLPIVAAVLALSAGAAFALIRRPAEAPVVTVYKSPACGCCSKWVEHLREQGFEVKTHDTDDVDRVKATMGVPGAMQSCHTAIVDGYVVEGHVPAAVIRRLLEERPKVAGVAVPGMPMGSPGMEGPRKQKYSVFTFDRQGKTGVYENR